MKKSSTQTRLYREDDFKLKKIGIHLSNFEGKIVSKPEAARRIIRIAQLPDNMRFLEEDATIKGSRKKKW